MKKYELLNNIKNQINFDDYSYITHLAVIGQDKLVEKRIEESPEAIYQALYGYGIIGDMDQIQQLISKCGDKVKSMQIAVRGLVRGNHLDELYKFKDYKAFKTDILLGYAQAGKQEMVATMVQRDPSLFEVAVKGYASGGHAKELVDLVKGTRFYGEAIYQTAKAGHVKLVNQLLAVCGLTEEMVINTPTDKEEIRLFGLINKALSGYCAGHHLEHAAHLLTRGADIQAALDELKSAGKPCLEAYIGLFIATPSIISEALLEQIQRELVLFDNSSLSTQQVESIKKLQTEYLKTSGSLVAFLSDLAIKSNVLEQLDAYFVSGAAELSAQRD